MKLNVTGIPLAACLGLFTIGCADHYEVWFVEHHKGLCYTNLGAAEICRLVGHAGGDYQTSSAIISDFHYEWGVRYELLVRRETIEGAAHLQDAPAVSWTVVEVFSEQQVPSGTTFVLTGIADHYRDDAASGFSPFYDRELDCATRDLCVPYAARLQNPGLFDLTLSHPESVDQPLIIEAIN